MLDPVVLHPGACDCVGPAGPEEPELPPAGLAVVAVVVEPKPAGMPDDRLAEQRQQRAQLLPPNPEAIVSCRRSIVVLAESFTRPAKHVVFAAFNFALVNR